MAGGKALGWCILGSGGSPPGRNPSEVQAYMPRLPSGLVNNGKLRAIQCPLVATNQVSQTPEPHGTGHVRAQIHIHI